MKYSGKWAKIVDYYGEVVQEGVLKIRDHGGWGI